ncbi:hypothetical protein QM012_008265 [Aureobasidium pullulans]|uniref:F-box domain-containing protein n=1 Tax=Aureobasidium pullulans TaxID=5580 RepID=A0ABR0TIZ6_AURPU
MTSSSPTRATLSTLPIEMLGRIFWFVDKSDLINLRLVCKLVCAVANKPFAIRHFSTRCHVITEHSMKTLLALSEHANLGAHIKNIILSPARAVLEVPGSGGSEDDGFVVDDSFVESGRFSSFMQQILSNLEQHSGSIAIGVDEDHCLGYGRQYLVNPERQLNEVIRWLVDKCFTELYLQDLDVENIACLNRYFTASLERITLEEFKLGSVCFRWRLLSSLFKHLSQLPNLTYCKFRRLHYSLPKENRSLDHCIQLLSGAYISCWASLLLIFPDGKAVIEISGLDTTRQLET